MNVNIDSMVLEVPPPTLEDILAGAGLEVLGGPSDWGNSFWSIFSRCPYEAALLRQEGWNRAFAEPLFTGSLFHEAMARVYTGRDPFAPVQAVSLWATANANGRWADYAQTIWAIASQVRDWLTAYLQFWQPAPAGQVCDVNGLKKWDFPRDRLIVEFELKVEEPFPYSMRGDIAVVSSDWSGQTCVAYVDHKTTSDPSGEWEEGWWMSGQMLGAAYLWDRVMVPRGAPPCRYVLINGIVKPTKWNRLTHPSFVRNVYPVRASAVRMWELSMLAMNARRLEYEATGRGLAAAGVPHQLHDVYPQTGAYAACFDRRYGHGRCSRLDHCIALMPTPPRPAVLPQAAAEAPRMLAPPPAEPPPTPLGGAPAEPPPPLPPSAAAGAPASPPEAPASQPPVEPPCPPGAGRPLEGTPYLTVTDAMQPSVPKVPCPDDYRVKVVGMDRAPHPPVRAGEAMAGWPYYVGGIVAWARGDFSAQGEAIFSLPGHQAVAFARDREAYLCVPILKGPDAPGDAPQSAAAPAAAPRVLGEAFVAGHGLAPVVHVGDFNTGGQKLLARVRAIAEAPGYFLACVGKDPSKRAMKAFVAKPEAGGKIFVAEAQKKVTGSETWVLLERMLEAAAAPAPAAAAPEQAAPQLALPETGGEVLDQPGGSVVR